MRKQISHKALHGLLALAFLITMVFGAFQFFGKLQATHAAGISMTEYPVPTANSDPENITSGPDGNLWFTEIYGNRIGRITPDGKITEYLMPSDNSYPFDITAGPDGNVWFTEGFAHKIGQISPAGVLTEYPVPNGNSPEGITSGPDGNLWFTDGNPDTRSSNIGRITPNGTITEFPASSSQFITTGPDGNLWFTQYPGGEIGRITPAGAITYFQVPPEASNYLSDITAGPDGNLWFAAENPTVPEIGRITPEGTFTIFPLPTGNYTPYGITSGPDGNLWFAEYGSSQIGRITPAGVITEFPVPTANSQPAGITIGPDGNLWFTEEYSNKIGRVNLNTATPPTGMWLKPATSFTVQEGNSIALSVQADPGGSPIADVTFSATWSGGSRKVCDLKKPDNNTTDHYSCKWSFVVGGSYIPAGSVTFNVTITDQNGNLISDPGGSRTGTFKRYHPQISGLTSNYWGGYYDYGGNTLYLDVRATWKVPALPGCGASENSESSTWVGLGGVDTNVLGVSHLEQIGTDSDCVNSTKTFCQKDIPCYFAWWESVSPDSGPNGIAFVNPGDTIVAHVQYKGSGMYHLSISDNGKVLFSKDEQGSSDTSAHNAADWIVEDPPGVTLANYGTVTFTGCSVDGKPITYGPTLVYTLLSSQQNNQLESVSGLNGIDNGFSVKWQQSR